MVDGALCGLSRGPLPVRATIIGASSGLPGWNF
jgi:hypothetical protein